MFWLEDVGQSSAQFSAREYSGWPGCKRDEGGALNAVLATLTSLVLVVHVIVAIVNKVRSFALFHPSLALPSLT